jgi:hypothetical protein
MFLLQNERETIKEGQSYLCRHDPGNRAICLSLKAGKGCHCSSQELPSLMLKAAVIIMVSNGE